jgi:3'-phosphoadenosine 5'-phosphosulfate sulfotransferase (PAPS reductase)/FAD synthetase
MEHIVALSGGKDSTAMALRLRELHPEQEYTYVCTPTGDELPPMIEHWLLLERLLDMKFTWLTSGSSLDSLINYWQALPNWRQRWCTKYLKIFPFEAYLRDHKPATIYVGMRYDEADKRDGIEVGDGVTKVFPMIGWEWGLGDVLSYLDERGVVVPERTDCGACFFQTLGEWWQLWVDYPDRYAKYEGYEKMTGHTFRSAQRDSHPASLAGLREEFEAGYQPKPRRMSDRRAMCSTCAH